MDHVREDDRIVVRLEPGERVLESLDAVREEYDIENGFLTGIGAVDRVTLGHYDTDAQEYSEEEFAGQFEVTNFSGNIGPDKIHTHIQWPTTPSRHWAATVREPESRAPSRYS